jgi:hypothetical protein
MMMLNDNIKTDLNRSLTNKSWLILEDVMPAEFGWDLPVYYLQYCSDNEDKNYGFPIGTMSYQLMNAENIRDINYYIEQLNSFLRTKIYAADILLSFSSKSTGNKSISKDIIFWQALGAAKVEVDMGETKITKELKQGDLLYLSSNDKYEIIPVTARATVAFYLEEETNEENSDSTD